MRSSCLSGGERVRERRGVCLGGNKRCLFGVQAAGGQVDSREDGKLGMCMAVFTTTVPPEISCFKGPVFGCSARQCPFPSCFSCYSTPLFFVSIPLRLDYSSMYIFFHHGVCSCTRKTTCEYWYSSGWGRSASLLVEQDQPQEPAV